MYIYMYMYMYMYNYSYILQVHGTCSLRASRTMGIFGADFECDKIGGFSSQFSEILVPKLKVSLNAKEKVSSNFLYIKVSENVFFMNQIPQTIYTYTCSLC